MSQISTTEKAEIKKKVVRPKACSAKKWSGVRRTCRTPDDGLGIPAHNEFRMIIATKSMSFSVSGCTVTSAEDTGRHLIYKKTMFLSAAVSFSV